MNGRGDQPARGSLGLQQLGNLLLGDAIFIERRGPLTLEDRHPLGVPVAPHRAAVQQVVDLAPQAVHQRLSRLDGEADQVDHNLGFQLQDGLGEASFGIERDPVGGHLAHLAPLVRLGVGGALPAADRDHLMPCAHQPRHQEGADVSTASDHNNPHGLILPGSGADHHGAGPQQCRPAVDQDSGVTTPRGSGR